MATSVIDPHPLYYHCGCGNGGIVHGCLDRFDLVEAHSDGARSVRCRDCGSVSKSYHRDLRCKGGLVRCHERTAIMVAADFALDAEIRAYNEKWASSSDGRAAALQAAGRGFEPLLVHDTTPKSKRKSQKAKDGQMDLFS